MSILSSTMLSGFLLKTWMLLRLECFISPCTLCTSSPEDLCCHRCLHLGSVIEQHPHGGTYRTPTADWCATEIPNACAVSKMYSYQWLIATFITLCGEPILETRTRITGWPGWPLESPLPPLWLTCASSKMLLTLHIQWHRQ
jgi:hypothetical protein